MLIAPIALSEKTLSRQELSLDKSDAERYGNCALGKKALYLGYWVFDRSRYIPLMQIERVYKRLAVSKGYYEGRTFGTLSYVMVVYDNGKVAKCRMTHEETVDALLDAIGRKTKIPVGKK